MHARRTLLRALPLFLFVPVFGCASTRPVEKPDAPAFTTVFIVRHAEKDTTTDTKDPGLTPQGQLRAEALRDVLAGPVGALYTTDTVRTRATLAPLAERLQVQPNVYDPKDQSALAKRLREQHRGQTVVVVGHSNTVLPLVEALGVKAPVAEMADDEFDYLFEVTIPAEGEPTVKTTHYGPPAHHGS
jgi:phosphohistidine phosphatase SixA